MTDTPTTPPLRLGAFRITLELKSPAPRLDTVLLQALRAQKENHALRHLSRTAFKGLFDDGKITIKGQRAKPSSAIAAGTTFVDILGFGEA